MACACGEMSKLKKKGSFFYTFPSRDCLIQRANQNKVKIMFFLLSFVSLFFFFSNTLLFLFPIPFQEKGGNDFSLHSKNWGRGRWAFFLSLWFVWLLIVPAQMKLVSASVGLGFAGIEWSYTTLKGKGRTTLSQLWILILYWPLVVAPLLGLLASGDPLFVGLDGGRDESGACSCEEVTLPEVTEQEDWLVWGEPPFPFSLYRVMFFPFVIWVLEVVEGHTLIFLCGFNPG